MAHLPQDSICNDGQNSKEERCFIGKGKSVKKPLFLATGTSTTGASTKSSVFVQEYSGAAMVIDKGHNLYLRNVVTDEHHEKRKIAGPFYPFSGKEDWDTFKWLSSLHVPMEKVDEFFNLPYVRFLLCVCVCVYPLIIL